MNFTENKKIKYRESDYYYACARIRAHESLLLPRSAFDRLLESKSAEEARAALSEFGIAGDGSFEDCADGILLREFSEVESFMPNPEFITVLRLMYDCHNIKTALKCRIRSVSPDGLFSPIGSVPAELVKTAVYEGNYSLLPEHISNMAECAKEAEEIYSKTRDPQLIDARMDEGCFADTLALTDALGDPFFKKWLTLRADVVNILTTVRISRMPSEDANFAYLEKMLVPGGALEESFFAEALLDGESGLWARLATTAYSPIAEAVDALGSYTLTAVEKTCENYITSLLKSSKYLLSSPAVPAAFLLALETQLKNLRIIMSGLAANEDREVTKERLREAYV